MAIDRHRTAATGRAASRAPATARFLIRAWAAADAIAARGASRYRREHDLPRLLPALWAAAELEGRAPDDIVRQLKQALARERSLGRQGHRSYNLVRHMRLAEALQAECDATGAQGPAKPR